MESGRPVRVLSQFIVHWMHTTASERTHKDMFLSELCEVLGVPRPDTKTSTDLSEHRYVFERVVKMYGPAGEPHERRIDLYREGCFILEAKQFQSPDEKKSTLPRRGTPRWESAMRMEALGQAVRYAGALDRPPPFIVVCDIGYCFDLYATFDGTTAYRPFPNAERNRLYFARLGEHREHVDTLRAIWLDPGSLDPSLLAAEVTREMAGHIAELARQLEDAGHQPERVARFLMRCLFTMFAEDINLIPSNAFKTALEHNWLPNPRTFQANIEQLWRAMNTGDFLFGLGKLLEFNGGLFGVADALPLTRDQLKVLLAAAKCNWSKVEPAIFGTLLERALNKTERHRLGAHYTPRAFVERLVKPTLEEPLRADWELCQAEVRLLVKQADAGPAKRSQKKPTGAPDLLAQAREAVNAFHRRLCSLRVLDPACGSGNFLYVALDLFMRLESEVIALAKALGDSTLHMFDGERLSVTPKQFLGIEKNPWAREIAEMVLWIGYLQWFYRTRETASGRIREPVLHNYHNIIQGDALLAWDDRTQARLANGEPATRWDGVTRKKSPVTGKLIPDESAQLPVWHYTNPRCADWPPADYVIGNPPFIGARKIRSYLDDEYVGALRAAYPEVPETSDLVMYWWHKAAELVESGAIDAFGFITTNSLVQAYSRVIIDRHLARGLFLRFAIADHPWTDASDGAAVRVAMTVGTQRPEQANAVLGVVIAEPSDANVEVELRQVASISSDLRAKSASIFGLAPLRANEGICFQGVVPAGHGFKLDREALAPMGYNVDRLPAVIRPYLIGRDLVQVPEERWIIDFNGFTEEAAQRDHPALFQRLRDTVFLERRHNKRATYRNKWWIFAEPRPAMRAALAALPRFIVTPYTAKHHPFTFITGDILPDAMAYAIASEDAYVLAVLSSRPHQQFALAGGGSLEDRPRYNSKATFFPFPFPASAAAQVIRIRALGEQIDAHRKSRQARHPSLTLTGMYNVLEKRRSRLEFDDSDQEIDQNGLIGVLEKIHNDLDAAVMDAYGWAADIPGDVLLANLVTLNATRAAEEKQGEIRWLRPKLQNPQGADHLDPRMAQKMLVADAVTPTSAAPASVPWPDRLPAQMATVRDACQRLPGAWTAAGVAAMFTGVTAEDVAEVLESLTVLGVLVSLEEPAPPRFGAPATRPRGG